MSLRQTLDFMLYDWLNVEQLCERHRHAEHNRETFDAVLDLSQKLADEKFAPYNRLVDVQEPEFDGERVHLPAETEQALNAFRDTGLMAAAMDHEVGGMQLPTVVDMASRLFLQGQHWHVGLLDADPRQCQHHPRTWHAQTDRGVCQARI